MIRASSLEECRRQLEHQLSNYFDRLVSLPSQTMRVIRPKIHTPNPQNPARIIVDFQSSPHSTSPLTELKDHIRLASPEEVLRTVQSRWASACRGLYITRKKARTVISGSENIEIIQRSPNEYSLRTISYRYHVLTNGRPEQPSQAYWYGLRMESDSFVGGWLLDHPLHHFQTGIDEELRIRASQDHSLTGFIDWCLRSFFEKAVWSQLYPSFYNVLKTGHLREYSFMIIANQIRQSIQQTGKVSLRPKWYHEWEKWRNDVALGTKIDDFTDSLLA